jgi:hypothetical protein
VVHLLLQVVVQLHHLQTDHDYRLVMQARCIGCPSVNAVMCDTLLMPGVEYQDPPTEFCLSPCAT